MAQFVMSEDNTKIEVKKLDLKAHIILHAISVYAEKADAYTRSAVFICIYVWIYADYMLIYSPMLPVF